jgi:hypothetical protein
LELRTNPADSELPGAEFTHDSNRFWGDGFITLLKTDRKKIACLAVPKS